MEQQNEEQCYIFNPYNSQNCEITLNDIQCILSKYGVPPLVNNFDLYKRAFIDDSYTYNQSMNIQNIVQRPDDAIPLKHKSNERLEFLGDGVLECVTKYYLYRRFRNENEGFMTIQKIAIVKNETIGKIAMEMGLNKWLIISRSSELKNLRNNLRKIGCLFEAFIGALFLDFNKLQISDEDKWFDNLFVRGPGFQMAQIFIENIFEKHINWTALLQTDDNYKKILQLKIQKEFKTTQHYLELNYNDELGYRMGVYLCVGYQIFNMNPEDALNLINYNQFELIQNYMLENEGKIFLFLGEGTHKNKKKAEQIACENALKILKD